MSNITVVDGEARPSRLNIATRAYEPGSVMKLVTAAGVFEEGLHNPESVIGAVADKITLYDRTIRDHDGHPTKDMTVSQIIANSSNVGTIRLAQELGKDRIIRYLHDFGVFQARSTRRWDCPRSRTASSRPTGTAPTSGRSPSARR